MVRLHCADPACEYRRATPWRATLVRFPLLRTLLLCALSVDCYPSEMTCPGVVQTNCALRLLMALSFVLVVGCGGQDATGQRCGGNTNRAQTCPPGYECVPASYGGPPVGDVGGICEKVSGSGGQAGDLGRDGGSVGADAQGVIGGDSGGAGGGETCPSTPPLNGSPCSGRDCYYEDCVGAGRTIARCHPEGTFEVQTTACTAVSCSLSADGGASCQAGTICLRFAGSPVSENCVSNSCGTGPIGCDCLSSCVGTCTLSGNAHGIGIICGICPPGQLCP
jgi:hypothetical protein